MQVHGEGQVNVSLHGGEDPILLVPGPHLAAMFDGEAHHLDGRPVQHVGAHIWQEQHDPLCVVGLGLEHFELGVAYRVGERGGDGSSQNILVGLGQRREGEIFRKYRKSRGFFEFFSIRNFIWLGILCIRNFVH